MQVYILSISKISTPHQSSFATTNAVAVDEKCHRRKFLQALQALPLCLERISEYGPRNISFCSRGNLQWSSPIRIIDHISGIPHAKYFRRLCELPQTISRSADGSLLSLMPRTLQICLKNGHILQEVAQLAKKSNNPQFPLCEDTWPSKSHYFSTRTSGKVVRSSEDRLLTSS
jgi:hypothetical protein